MVATEMMGSTVAVTNSARRAPELKESTTASGIRVITNDNGAPSVGLTFALLGGSRSEGDATSGFSHLLASTAFNGSANKSPLAMIRDMQNAGSSFSASADRESTRFSVQCTDDHVHSVVASVADFICNPVNADKYYYIKENHGQAKLSVDSHAADGDAQLDDLLHEAAYGENSPLGRPCKATSSLRAEVCDIMAFRAGAYTAGNLVITGSGISHETLRNAVDGTFTLSEGKSAVPTSAYTGGDIKVRTDMGGVSHAGIAFPVPAGAGAGAYSVLAHHLAVNGVAGVPAGSIKAFHHQYSDSGIFGFRFHGTAAETAQYAQAAIAALKAAGSASNKGAALAAMESANADQSMMTSAITGVAVDAAHKVGAADVANAAKAALGATPAYAVFGTTSGTASYADIKKWCK